jgi:hypothetical protein
VREGALNVHLHGRQVALAVSTCAVLVSVGLLPFTGVAAHATAYACSSVLAFVGVAIARRLAEARILNDGVLPSRASTTFATGLVVAGLALSIVHAWYIAVALS